MKHLEKILILTVLIGIFTTVVFSNSAGGFVILSFTLLSLIYLFFSFALINNIRLRNAFKKVSYKNISSKRIRFSIVTGVALFISITAILYKFQLWPGVSSMNYIGVMFTPIILTILIIHSIQYKKSKLPIDKIQIIRISMILVIQIVLSFTPNSNWAKVRFSEHPDYINAIIAFDKDPSNIILFENMEKERLKTFK